MTKSKNQNTKTQTQIQIASSETKSNPRNRKEKKTNKSLTTQQIKEGCKRKIKSEIEKRERNGNKREKEGDKRRRDGEASLEEEDYLLVRASPGLREEKGEE